MSEKEFPVSDIPIGEIVPDSANPNRGNPRGRKLIKSSLKKYGAGRSILLDEENNVIAGNKVLEAAKAQGFKKVQVVDVDGDTLVAVRRRDLNLKRDKKARELAIADSRAAQIDVEWDPDVLRGTDADLTTMFEPIELDRLLNDGKNSRQPNTIDLQPPPKMIWMLLGIPFNRFDDVQQYVAGLEENADISVQTSRDK